MVMPVSVLLCLMEEIIWLQKENEEANIHCYLVDNSEGEPIPCGWLFFFLVMLWLHVI